jgi:hypothetical protein
MTPLLWFYYLLATAGGIVAIGLAYLVFAFFKVALDGLVKSS